MNRSSVPSGSPWTRSELARQVGVGAETLRFYEQKGLLRKAPRNDSGYRQYGTEDLERLHFIRRSQDLGFSLGDIQALLALTGNIRTPRREVRDFAEARLGVIRQKIEHLQAMERALAGLVTKCSGKGRLEGCPIADFLAGAPAPSDSPLTHCHETQSSSLS